MITRTPILTALPVTVGEAKMHARIYHADDDDGFAMMIATAAADIEDAAALALLPQTVIYETLPMPGRVIVLPIGPAIADPAPIVEAVAEGGAATVLTGWTLFPGNRPRVELVDTPAHRVRITYRAQTAATPATVPADLKHAIADQAARMFDNRGGVHDRGAALSPHAARVVARYRGVRA